MSQYIQMPVFPLSLLPMPGELVPLHIFEPRYQQLLQDLEANDIEFGIFCTHELNNEKLGSIMRLESILKRYPGGESDIVVKCTGIFRLEKLYRTYGNKQYGGGDIDFLNTEDLPLPTIELHQSFVDLQRKRNLSMHNSPCSLFQIANELNLDLFDRYKFITSAPREKNSFLLSEIKFRLHVLVQEKIQEKFFLN